MCVSCYETTYRTDDCFIVLSKEVKEGTYYYQYKVKHITTDNFYLNEYYILSNDNYELGDTIRLVKSNN